jgi:hypothetical protein
MFPLPKEVRTLHPSMTSTTPAHLAQVQPLSPVLEEPEEAPEELVAAAASHLDGLLSFLSKAARNNCELPTSQVQLLVGAKPRGTTIARYGFTFRPAGKHGQETSWKVER